MKVPKKMSKLKLKKLKSKLKKFKVTKVLVLKRKLKSKLSMQLNSEEVLLKPVSLKVYVILLKNIHLMLLKTSLKLLKVVKVVKVLKVLKVKMLKMLLQKKEDKHTMNLEEVSHKLVSLNPSVISSKNTLVTGLP